MLAILWLGWAPLLELIPRGLSHSHGELTGRLVIADAAAQDSQRRLFDELALRHGFALTHEMAGDVYPPQLPLAT